MQTNTYHLGLIGYPLSHSLSPILHQTALSAADLVGSYHKYEIPPDNHFDVEMRTLIHKITRKEIQGLNVTIPFKQAVIPYLDSLSAEASKIGAINTIAYKDGKIWGHNTDVPGFIRDINKLDIPEEGKAVVLGAGGAAKAVVFSLLMNKWEIVVAARNLEKAVHTFQNLAQQSLGPGIQFINLTSVDISTIQLEEINLVVNATPVGMYPNIDHSPWPEELPLPKSAVVYDLIYNPRETKLLSIAKKAEIGRSNGIGMLIEQAAISFEIWTEQPAHRIEMQKAIQVQLPENNERY